LYFKDEAAATKKLAELAKQQKKEGQAGLDVPLELRVMAIKAAKRLAPFNKSVLGAAEFHAAHLERESSSVLVSAAIEGIWTERFERDFRNVTYAISAELRWTFWLLLSGQRSPIAASSRPRCLDKARLTSRDPSDKPTPGKQWNES
jgi:hypothetical protein